MLKHLNYSYCPDCRAKIIKVVKEHLHTNGNWNESITFGCGAVKRWSPNFMSEYRNTVCPRSKEGISLRRVDALNRVKSYIKDIDIDEEFKDALLKSLTKVNKSL